MYVCVRACVLACVGMCVRAHVLPRTHVFVDALQIKLFQLCLVGQTYEPDARDSGAASSHTSQGPD